MKHARPGTRPRGSRFPKTLRVPVSVDQVEFCFRAAFQASKDRDKWVSLSEFCRLRIFPRDWGSQLQNWRVTQTDFTTEMLVGKK